MEIDQLRYFVHAAKLESFTRAAEACFISQPSLSQQIIKLEEELGQPMFDRIARRVVLTDAGRILWPLAEKILISVDELKERLMAAPEKGSISIGAPPTIAPYWLPGWLQKLASQYPSAKIEMVEDVTSVLIQRLLDCSLDLAILSLPINEKLLHSQSIAEEELLLVCPIEHPLSKKEKVLWKDLSEEPLLVLNETHCLTGNTLKFCHRKHLNPSISTRASQLRTLQELVSLGQGLSFIPERAAKGDNAAGRIYRTLSHPKPTRTLGLVRHSERYQTFLMQRFSELVRNEDKHGIR
jgi:LysR family transcriptional regulator, hydrogen peroxide-inducible genes activator